ncbi:MAG: phosphatase PAP2 family protein [Actinomycetota bacterium]
MTGLALTRSLREHPWRWTAVLLLVPLAAFPQIDISVSALFFSPVRQIFPFRIHPVGEFVRKQMPIGLFALAGAVAALWAGAELLRRPLLGVTRRIGAYLLLSLALGPGLLVNLVLKDQWGRPRPSTIAEFSGKLHYARPLWPSGQCDDNCSFPSGHAALAFWLVAFAFLAPPRHRPLAVAAALLFGALVGLVRIAQGGHFLSDVAFSGVLTVGLTWWLYCRLVTPRRTPSPKNVDGETAESR